MTNEKIKTPRASQTRTAEKRPTTWTPPSSLDAPRPKDGYRHRWIRLEIMGQDDTKNISSKLRSGWELVRADEYPGENFSTITEGKYTGVIGHGGLALARIPEEVAKARNEYFARRTQESEQAIKNDLLKDQHPSMPINSDRQTRVTFGGTNKK
jgi:hypothetical protein